MNGKLVGEILNKLYPLELGYDWDNNGLQIGNLNKNIDSIMISLDVTIDVVKEAAEKNVDLLLVHHPLIFKPLKIIDVTTEIGNIIETLIKNDIALYVTHTNFDLSDEGMNDILAEMLEITDVVPIEFVDETHGLGRIGKIKECNLEDYISKVKKVLNLDTVKLIGSEHKIVNQVAICGGSGSSLIDHVAELGADLYVTGDIGYHHALHAKALGLTVLDVGHDIEKYFMSRYRELLLQNGVTAKIFLSKTDTTPYKFL